MKEHPSLLAIIIGSGFGSGFWPWGPGTAGALLATMMWLGLSVVFTTTQLAFVTLALIILFTILGTWATGRLMPFWGEDPSKVVVDEMVGVWIPLLICPSGSYQYAFLSFVLFRFFDILKPLGIRSLDRHHGAFWVMADDILAGIYSLMVVFLIKWVI